MKTNFIKLTAFFTLVTSFAIAQEQDSTKTIEEVVISDTKFAQSKEKSGKIIEKITQKDLENRKGQSIATVLSSVAGVEVNGQQSGTGKDLGYYIRGGRNNQVLILVDGTPITDPSGTSIAYDLRLLSVDQVESVEILKGSSSTLYGSGAATAVISITLKKASNDAIVGNAYFNLGTQNTANDKKTSGQDANQGFSFSGKSNKISFLTSLNSTETKGISEASGVGFEDDSFSRINLLQKLGFQATKKLSFDGFASYDRLKTSYDAAPSKDESRNGFLSNQFRFGFSPKYKYKRGEFNLVSGFTTLERKYQSFSAYSSAPDFIDHFGYKSKLVSVDAFNKYNVTKELFVITGTQFQYLDMKQDGAYGTIDNAVTKFNIVDPYATLVYNSKFGLNVNTGARLNMHSLYGNNITWNVNPSYNFKNLPLKLISSISTAYITPSLYQLFSPYGNTSLTPEEAKTVEAGFELGLLNKKITLNSVAFYRQDKNKIDYYSDPITWVGSYINITDNLNYKGIETTINYKACEYLQLNANYTFTQVESDNIILIPKHKANASFTLDVTKRVHWNTQYQFVDKRTDKVYDEYYNESIAVLNAYKLVNSNVSFDVIKNKMNLFIGVTNAFNEDFVEKSGYSTRGRNYKLGLNLKF